MCRNIIRPRGEGFSWETTKKEISVNATLELQKTPEQGGTVLKSTVR